jgi:hypothetical protein
MTESIKPSDARHHYRVFGLTIASDLPLPEATPIDRDGIHAEADVQIELGAVPNTLPEGRKLANWLEVQDSKCLLRFEGIGRFLVEAGRRIVVEKAPSASYDDLRGFLLGSGLGALAHQRGLVPLHVSAVAAPFGAIAFTGESGAGKSTLAAMLNQELGWPLICDDVAVLRCEADGFHLDSGVNTVKLWRDALRALNRSSEGLRRDLTRHDKFHAILSDRFFNGSLPLKCLLRLEWGDEVRLERVYGRRAYQIALGATYRPELATLLSNRTNIANGAMTLSTVVEFSVLSNTKAFGKQSELARFIESNLDVNSQPKGRRANADPHKGTAPKN